MFRASTYNKGIIGEGMSDLQVLEKVSTPVVRVPPRHWGTDGTYLNRQKEANANIKEQIMGTQKLCVISKSVESQREADFLLLDVCLEHAGKYSVQPGRPDRGSGSCSRGRWKCSDLALDCGKETN